MENIVNSANAVASTPTVLRRLCTGVILSPVPSVIEENGLVMQKWTNLKIFSRKSARTRFKKLQVLIVSKSTRWDDMTSVTKS
jgi:hypothetical protein